VKQSLAVPKCQANRDLAIQLQTVREFAFRLAAEQTPQHASLNIAHESSNDGTIQTQRQPAHESRATRMLFDAQHYKDRLRWLKSRSTSRDDAWAVPIKELERALAMGPLRKVASAPPDNALLEIQKNFPHCAQVVEHLCRRSALARLVPSAPFKMPPILLSGPPGVGKTAFSQDLAQVMGVPLVNIDVSTLDAEFRMTGLDAGYSTGKPGMIWDALQNECMSPIIVLDEIDKVPTRRDSGLGCLLALLEPSTASRFVDAFTGAPIDASQIQWVATCNDALRVDAAARSRLCEFEIDLPTPQQMPAVIKSVYRRLRADEPWGMAFHAELSIEVIEALSTHTPREIWKLLSDGCANAATDGRRVLMAKDMRPNRSRQCTARKMGFV